MPTEKDINVPIKKIPEQYIVTSEGMDKIVRCLYEIAYPSYDIPDDIRELALALVEVYDNA